MRKIKWCCRAKNGIEFIEPNDNLSRAYLEKSENALKAASVLKDNKDWEISSSYYTMYFALYAILMKLGIKCEIHVCTIEFMKEFLLDYFTKGDYYMLKSSMEARIDAQYYLNKQANNSQYKIMIKQAPIFLVKCKEILFRIREKEIEMIRSKLRTI